MKSCQYFLALFWLSDYALAFRPLQLPQRQTTSTASQRLAPLFMGRAAAVRAATKAKTDMKKAKTNALYGKKIIMAVKEGGSSDPNANRKLADVIKAAKANSVPVDNINRAIKKATEGNAGDFKERIFEAYGFGGASFVISVLTDNDNRANSDVRSTVNKRNGKMAEQGSVLFMYDRRGVVTVKGEVDEEALLEAAIEAGLEDFEVAEGDEEGTTVVYSDPKEVAMLFEALKAIGTDEGDMKMTLSYITKAPVEVSDDEFDKNMEIVDALEDLDDVDAVEHNMSN